MRSESRTASKAHSSASKTASIASPSNSRRIAAGAGRRGARMRWQKAANWAAVTFENRRATA